MPAVVLLLGAVLAALETGVAQVRCSDAARTGARAAARGEPVVRVVAVARAAAPRGARVTVSVTASEAVVSVSADVALPAWGGPGLGVAASAHVPRELVPRGAP